MIAALLQMSLGTCLTLAQQPAEPIVPAAPAAAPQPAAPVVPAEPAPAAPIVAAPLAPAPDPTVPVVTAEPVPEGPEPAPPRRVAFAFLPAVTAGVSPLPSLDLAFFLGGRLPGRPWFLGYQFTFSSGLAERYTAGLMTHRHHLTAMRSFGRGERGFASLGGGVAVLALYPVVEVEGRVGVRFGPKRRGVFGALARLGWNIHYREQAPMPQLGLMFGVALL